MRTQNLRKLFLSFFLFSVSLAREDASLRPYKQIFKDFRAHFNKRYPDKATKHRRFRCLRENINRFVDSQKPLSEQLSFNGRKAGERVLIGGGAYSSPCKFQAAIYENSDLCPSEFAALYLSPIVATPRAKVCNLEAMKKRFPTHSKTFELIENGEIDPTDVLLSESAQLSQSAAIDLESVRETVNRFYKLAPKSEYPPNYSPTICELNPIIPRGRLLQSVNRKAKKESERKHRKKSAKNEKFSENLPKKERKHKKVKTSKKSSAPIQSPFARPNRPKSQKFRKYINYEKHLGPVGFQRLCKSCYAFAAARSIDAQHSITYNSKIQVSVQDLLDCSPRGNGCNGGSAAQAFDYIARYGISFERHYPYLAIDQDCRRKYSPFRVYDRTIVRTYIKSGMRNLVKALHRGIVSANGSSSPELQFLGNGILTGAYCTPYSPINHSLLIYGYDRKSNPPVLFFRNFWGEHWGDRGNGKMLMGPLTNLNKGVCNYALTNENFRVDIFD